MAESAQMTEATAAPAIHPVEVVPITSLKPHPRNYRRHPDDQRDHIEASMREHGVYRNVVIARDGTILAGHGVVEAATHAGVTEVPVVRLDVDPDDPAAIQVLVGDNGAGLLAEVDHRLLTDHLKALAEMDALLGTGYDEMALAALTAIDFEPNLDPSITSHEVTDDDLRLAQDKLGKEPGERATLDLWCPACGHHYQVDPGEALMLAKRNDPTE